LKTAAFLIFFSIVLSVYGLLSYYIYHRGAQALEALPAFRTWYAVLFLFFSVSYVAARFLERVYIGWLSDGLTWIGSFWLGAFIYLLLTVLVIDLVRVADWLVPFLPRHDLAVWAGIKLKVFYGVLSLIVLVLGGSYYNARHPVIRDIRLKIDKTAGDRKQLHIAAISDVHLGTMIGKKRLMELVQKINGLKPDIILIAGDVVDEDLKPVIRENLGENLRGLSAPLGVWAITGNHEYIGGVEPAVKYLEEHGIRVLRDSSILLDGGIVLAGREDRDISRFSGKNRKSVKELLQGRDMNMPVILLDHQPFNLEKAVEAGVDLQLSGHTHHGQMWPLNYLTKAIYQLSSGYLKIGETHFYVSNGVGTWGPPLRSGNRPEILSIMLNFN
jgi:hypothetical protein